MTGTDALTFEALAGTAIMLAVESGHIRPISPDG
jgi:hypothetical protein